LMCVAAELAYRTDNWRAPLDRIGALLPLWWVVSLGLLLLADHLYGTDVIFRAHHQVGQEVFYGLMAAFAVLPIAFGFAPARAGGRLLTSWPVAYVGTVSYGLYLWHNQLSEYIADHGFGRGSFESTPVPQLVALVAVVMVAAVAAASVSWFGLERPLQRRSRR